MKIWVWTLRVHGFQKYRNYGNYGETGSFSWPFFSFSHTRLGRGARDWGQMLTTLVILRTLLRTLALSLPLSLYPKGLPFFLSLLDSPIRECDLQVLRQLERGSPFFTTRL